MRYDFTAGRSQLSVPHSDRVFPAAQIEVRQRGEVLWSAAYGWLDPETRTLPTQLDTLFDLASVTKLFVVTAFMTLVEAGVVDLDQPVATVLPEFSGERPIRPYDDPLKPGATVTVAWEGAQPTTVDAGRVTFRHLLTHTSGLPAWRPLYQRGQPRCGPPRRADHLLLLSHRCAHHLQRHRPDPHRHGNREPDRAAPGRGGVSPCDGAAGLGCTRATCR